VYIDKAIISHLKYEMGEASQTNNSEAMNQLDVNVVLISKLNITREEL